MKDMKGRNITIAGRTYLNLEIKAKCFEQDKIREKILSSDNAIFKGIDRQIDTYFNVNFGRLKLREGDIENCLIFYDRENVSGPKQSNVILYDQFDKDSGRALKKILMMSLGKLAEVDKKREIFFIENVKFHLDTVKDLGTFIEIEALSDNGKITKDKLLEQCNYYLELFEINDEDLLKDSYSDMIKIVKMDDIGPRIVRNK